MGCRRQLHEPCCRQAVPRALPTRCPGVKMPSGSAEQQPEDGAGASVEEKEESASAHACFTARFSANRTSRLLGASQLGDGAVQGWGNTREQPGVALGGSSCESLQTAGETCGSYMLSSRSQWQTQSTPEQSLVSCTLLYSTLLSSEKSPPPSLDTFLVLC